MTKAKEQGAELAGTLDNEHPIVRALVGAGVDRQAALQALGTLGAGPRAAGPSTTRLDAVLNSDFRATAYPASPATVYVSLHTADPGQTGASEVTTAASTGWVGYARQGITASTGFNAPVTSGSARQISNVGVVTFPASSSTSGTVVVTYLGLWDAATGGNWLRGGALASSQTIGANAPSPTIAAGALVITQS